MKPTTFYSIFSAPPVLVTGGVWYLIARKLAWLWRLVRVARGGCAAVLVIAGVFLVAGCGGEDPPKRIAIIDVSGSTVDARDDYLNDFRKTTRELALEKGTLHVIVIGGKPLTESKPLPVTFSTEENGRLAEADLLSQAETVIGQVQYLLENPPVENRDTALIRAFVLAAGSEAGRTEGPLDIVVYSDGIEYSEDLDMFNDPLDDAAITTKLDRLEADKLIPTLTGVPVRFVLPGLQHKGPEVDMIQVESFWRAWGERSGATVTWR